MVDPARPSGSLAGAAILHDKETHHYDRLRLVRQESAERDMASFSRTWPAREHRRNRTIGESGIDEPAALWHKCLTTEYEPSAGARKGLTGKRGENPLRNRRCERGRGAEVPLVEVTGKVAPRMNREPEDLPEDDPP